MAALSPSVTAIRPSRTWSPTPGSSPMASFSSRRFADGGLVLCRPRLRKLDRSRTQRGLATDQRHPRPPWLRLDDPGRGAAHSDNGLSVGKACHFPDAVTRAIDAERRAHFRRERGHFESRHALILTWRPPERRRSGLARYVYSDEASRSTTFAGRPLQSFETSIREVEQYLSNVIVIERMRTHEFVEGRAQPVGRSAMGRRVVGSGAAPASPASTISSSSSATASQARTIRCACRRSPCISTGW